MEIIVGVIGNILPKTSLIWGFIYYTSVLMNIVLAVIGLITSFDANASRKFISDLFLLDDTKAIIIGVISSVIYTKIWMRLMYTFPTFIIKASIFVSVPVIVLLAGDLWFGLEAGFIGSLIAVVYVFYRLCKGWKRIRFAGICLKTSISVYYKHKNPYIIIS